MFASGEIVNPEAQVVESTTGPEERLHIRLDPNDDFALCGRPISRPCPYLKPKHYGTEGADWCYKCGEKMGPSYCL